MKIKVFLERQNKTRNVTLKEGSTLSELMELLKINPSEVIAVRNNEIITEDTKLKDKDEIKFLAVISGG